MHLVFVHGWAFHAGIWDGIVARLPDATVTRVDLGFIAGGPKQMPTGRAMRSPWAIRSV